MNMKTELLAGTTTFLTMSYILFVNPAILAAAGVPFAAAATATAIGAGILCLLMGFITNRPLAMASGMGLNAVIAFSVIGFQQSHVPWQVGMSVIFIEGLIILILVLAGLREAVMNAIPPNLKRAIGIGIGLFITMIGLNEGGLIRPAPITLVALGDFSQRYVWVTLVGLLAILAFMSLRIRGAILWGLIAATLAALFLGVASWPSAFLSWPDFSSWGAPFHRIGDRWALWSVFTPLLLTTVFSVMLTDFFDTLGTVMAVGEQAGFIGPDGKVPGARRILLVDSFGALFGGLIGSSSITTYVESAAGVAEGGRTGLTAIATGALFLLSSFLAPLIHMIGGGFRIPNASQYQLFVSSGFQVPPDVMSPPGAGDYVVYPITAAALIVVGALMMRTIRDIEWDRFDESFPAFLTIVGIPMTYSISDGIGFGFIGYTLMKTLAGKKVHPFMYVVTACFVAAFLLPHLS